MSAPPKKSDHGDWSRKASRDMQGAVVGPLRRWYQHPLVVFFVPLITLLCFPHVCNVLVAHGSAHPYNEVHLQEIATLLDDIYTTLANMTFIPHTSIKRGPHQINLTAIPCKRDPAVLRLMEILPVYEGEDWVGQNPDGELNGFELNGVGIFGEGVEADKSRNEPHWEEWFDPPTLLNRLKVAYQTAAWSPWETSNREEGWGVDSRIIIDLLRKNGWPETSNPDQFNVDFIRASHKRPRRGHAEEAFKRIEKLQDKVPADDSRTPWADIGHISRVRGRLARHEEELAKAKDEQEKWILKWRVQKTTRELEQAEVDLQEAKQQIQQLCPNESCYADGDSILWQFRALEKEYEKAKHNKNATIKCQKQAEQLPAWAPPDPNRINNCAAQIELAQSWLFLAYSQSKAEALEYCQMTNSSLLPSDTLEDRVKATIARLERSITADTDRVLEMADFENSLPEHATKALEELRMRDFPVENGHWYIRERIQWLQEQSAEGGDKERLWQCLDDPECALSTL